MPANEVIQDQAVVRLQALGFDGPTTDAMIGLWGAPETERLLNEELAKGDLETPTMAHGDEMRGQPRTTVPATRLYMRLIRELGRPSAHPKASGPPAPARAWLEIQQQTGSIQPTFSHPFVAEALGAMGGYAGMRRVGMDRARGQYIQLYKELVQGW